MYAKSVGLFSLLLLFQIGFGLRAVPKLDFGEDVSEKTTETPPDAESFLPEYDNSEPVILKKRSEPYTEQSEIVCNKNKCVVTLNDEDSSSKQKKIADVHVRILTNSGDSKTKNDDDDLPVIKGYAGMDPKEFRSGDTKTTTEKIIIPSIHLEPPKYEPRNWHEYLDWKTKMETTTWRPPNNYRPSKPDVNFHPYNIGNPDYRENNIPSGWRPISPPRYPEDSYHYNMHGREDGFVNMNPDFVTYCKCLRKPFVVQKPSFIPHHHSWVERTTKTPIDGKLSPPFNREEKRQNGEY